MCFITGMTDNEFHVEAMVRGYHIYQSIWDAAVNGEVLSCYREVGNTHDPSAIAVRKDAVTVGHIPRAISSVCSIFICQGGIISCMVNQWKQAVFYRFAAERTRNTLHHFVKEVD